MAIGAMDAFSGYKRAAEAMLPNAVEVIDPFHVVKLAGEKATKIRCRLQRDATGGRGVKGERLRTDRQRERVERLPALDVNRPLAMAHDVYQKIIECYGRPDRHAAKTAMGELIDSLAAPGATKGARELGALGWTLKRHKADVLAYSTHPHSSNGPTEAVNGRLETLRGTAMGFRNPEHYRQRSFIHSGRLKDLLTH